MICRSSVNLSHIVYAYDRKRVNGGEPAITATSLEAGIIRIPKAMWGTYRDLSGTPRRVGGYLTKVRYVAGPTPFARNMLQRIEHTCRTLPGAQEARRMMRLDTQALHTRCGTLMSVVICS